MAAALVAYSDSDSEAEETSVAPRDPPKRKASEVDDNPLPSLPDSFLDLYAAPVRTAVVDDPSLHGGRQRTNAHVQGNWPSHVYVEWRPAITAADLLKATVNDLQKITSGDGVRIQSLLEDDMGTELPLHISLSRSLNLQSDQRQPFLENLGRAVRQADIKPFTVSLTHLSWEANYERNRWFLIAVVQRPPGDGLNRLLSACNSISMEFRQPALYVIKDAAPKAKAVASARKRRKTSDPTFSGNSSALTDMSEHFHVSVAWTLQEPSQSLREATENSQNFRDATITFKVTAIKIKMGNSIENVHLDNEANNSTSILG